MEDILAQCLSTNVREVLVGPAPMCINNPRCDSLSDIMVGNRNMFLFKFAVWDLGTLDDPKVVTEQICGLRNRDSQAP